MSAVENDIIGFFKKKEGVAALYLFGSHAKGVAREQSDIDIAVLFEPASVPSKLDLFLIREALSELFQKDVDLICLNEASPIIGMQVYKYGKCLFGADSKYLSNYLIIPPISNMIIQAFVSKKANSKIEVIEESLKLYRFHERMSLFNEEYANLKNKKDAWKEELAEREVLEGTLMDDLEYG